MRHAIIPGKVHFFDKRKYGSNVEDIYIKISRNHFLKLPQDSFERDLEVLNIIEEYFDKRKKVIGPVMIDNDYIFSDSEEDKKYNQVTLCIEAVYLEEEME